MLLNLFRSLFGAPHRTDTTGGEFPAERLKRMQTAHERAPTNAHRDILFGNMRVGEDGLVDFVDRCIADSCSRSPPLKAFHRPLASYFLARYFLHAMRVDGKRAECGVFQGTSALVMCRAARTVVPDYAGADLYLIDSFAGLSAPTEEDRFAVRTVRGQAATHALPGGWLSAPVEAAQAALRDYPQATILQGWIPEAFGRLPESRWSFVHLDLDLHAPTLASLEYFFPRLSPGGVMICDDYGAPLFPGAHRAWDEFCDAHDVPYIVLDTGQSVILKA